MGSEDGAICGEMSECAFCRSHVDSLGRPDHYFDA